MTILAREGMQNHQATTLRTENAGSRAACPSSAGELDIKPLHNARCPAHKRVRQRSSDADITASYRRQDDCMYRTSFVSKSRALIDFSVMQFAMPTYPGCRTMFQSYSNSRTGTPEYGQIRRFICHIRARG
ncbi:hypothetical protein HDE78_000144 [Rhodanobacter sp. K2T2]|uniref:hypothetical protein n=1 Tax=Rhodanobacter sp. K2T2 TaxID=2723085 RepID=UPI0015C7033E|nr:hypothetical protein [Rhodanobacter sp. K2T2]NYE27219.1 hypothetical protein [Rhodanobacter sp. K2T2]